MNYYTVTVKKIKDGKPATVNILSSHDVHDLIRRVFIKSGRSDDSADIQTINLMIKVDNNQAQVLRNEQNNYVMVIRKQVNTK